MNQNNPRSTGQPRHHSAAEAALNTASGFAISYLAGLFIFPAAGMPVTPSQNFVVVSAYTVISLVRSYVWRRAFNHWGRHR